MGCRQVVVLLLVMHDGRNGRCCARILALQLGQLVVQMGQHHLFHRHRRGCNGVLAKQRGDAAQHIATGAAQPVTAAAALAAALQLGGKYGAVFQLMLLNVSSSATMAGAVQRAMAICPA